MFTPLLLRAVAIAAGLSLATAGGFAVFNSVSGAVPNQGLMVPVAFTDATGQHRILPDSGQPAELQGSVVLHDAPPPNVEAVEQAAPTPVPPVMTAPGAASAAAAVPLAAAAPPVTIVRTAPVAVAVQPVSGDHPAARSDRDDEHASKQDRGAQHAAKHHGHGGGD
jgi:hypothetical protein